MEAIKVENLSKSFEISKKQRKKSGGRPNGKTRKKQNHERIGPHGELLAVNNISFNVMQGEIFGFLGPNGAGKTTTIRTLTGVLEPSNGSVEILGMDAMKHKIKVKQQIGNVPEMANVYFSLSGWENLMLMGELYGVSKKERNRRGKVLLELFDLYQKRNLDAKKYSKGMKQRLLLCMALMSDPKILFLDEPTSGLDVQSARLIKKIIKDYNDEGVTIFLTTHDMSVANELCDRIAIINQGRIISLDTPDNLRKITQEYQAMDLVTESPADINEIELLKGIRKVDIEGTADQLHIIVDNINDAVGSLVDYLRDKGISIVKLSSHQVKLEDAFLKIIGEGEKNE